MTILEIETGWEIFSEYRSQYVQKKLTLLVNFLNHGILDVAVAQTFLFRTMKTVGRYLVPTKIYLKNGHPPAFSKWAVVTKVKMSSLFTTDTV